MCYFQKTSVNQLTDATAYICFIRIQVHGKLHVILPEFEKIFSANMCIPATIFLFSKSKDVIKLNCFVICFFFDLSTYYFLVCLLVAKCLISLST